MKHDIDGSVIVAIPAYNEAATIRSVVLAARRYADVVIVVDDGSSDDTAALASSAGATVVRHDRNRGKAAGIMTAFKAASERQCLGLVLIDGDGQHNPDEIPLLLEPVLNGSADIVVGSRFLSGHNAAPFYRTIGQRVLNVATHIGSGVRCSDSQCGYRAFSRAAFSRMRLHETFLHGLAVESEMQFEAAEHQLRLAEVPVIVTYEQRARRSPIKHGFGVLYRVLRITHQRRPALKYSLPAGTFAIGGAVTFFLSRTV